MELSGGSYENPIWSKGPGVKDSTIKREGYFLEFSIQLRKLLKRTPLMVTGGFRSLEGMSNAIKNGIDIIGVGRPFCVYPDFPNKMFSGELAKVESYDYPQE